LGNSAGAKFEKDHFDAYLQRNVVDHLIKVCGFPFEEKEVQRCVGLVKTNCVHIEHDYMKREGTSGRAVYPIFSILSHSCSCNAKYR